jgi:hypothetical protein
MQFFKTRAPPITLSLLAVPATGAGAVLWAQAWLDLIRPPFATSIFIRSEFKGYPGLQGYDK